MKVKDLIKELSECNQEANVSFVVGDEDNNVIDTYDFEVHSKDVDEYVELFCLNYNLVDMGEEYLSTNLKNDQGIDLNKEYRVIVDETRNGNLNLVDWFSGKVIIQFQNNKIEQYGVISDREEMQIRLNTLGYDVFDITEFCDEFFQNYISYEENLEEFKKHYEAGQ